MEDTMTALLIRDREDDFCEKVTRELEALEVSTIHLRTCEEVKCYIATFPPPLLLLTDPFLTDGDWLDVLDLAIGDRERANVIVLSPLGNLGLYVRVTGHGAFDFIADSFSASELNRTLRSALDEAIEARKARCEDVENREAGSPLEPAPSF